jgi:hypothetical protein
MIIKLLCYYNSHRSAIAAQLSGDSNNAMYNIIMILFIMRVSSYIFRHDDDNDDYRSFYKNLCFDTSPP